jgi:hypothetical protein
MNRHLTPRSLAAIAAALLLSFAAHAQSFRAYLSIDGNDANPCTLAAPSPPSQASERIPLAAQAGGKYVKMCGEP